MLCIGVDIDSSHMEAYTPVYFGLTLYITINESAVRDSNNSQHIVIPIHIELSNNV